MIEEPDSLVIAACNDELKRETFDDYLNQESYRLAKKRESQALPMCRYCMYNDKIKGKCLANKRQRAEQRLCWRARNILLLRRNGLYGNKTRSPRGID